VKILPSLAAVESLWTTIGRNADVILQAEGTIRMLSEFVGAINDSQPSLHRQPPTDAGATYRR